MLSMTRRMKGAAVDGISYSREQGDDGRVGGAKPQMKDRGERETHDLARMT